MVPNGVLVDDATIQSQVQYFLDYVLDHLEVLFQGSCHMLSINHLEVKTWGNISVVLWTIADDTHL